MSKVTANLLFQNVNWLWMGGVRAQVDWIRMLNHSTSNAFPFIAAAKSLSLHSSTLDASPHTECFARNFSFFMPHLLYLLFVLCLRFKHRVIYLIAAFVRANDPLGHRLLLLRMWSCVIHVRTGALQQTNRSLELGKWPRACEEWVPNEFICFARYYSLRFQRGGRKQMTIFQWIQCVCGSFGFRTATVNQ